MTFYMKLMHMYAYHMQHHDMRCIKHCSIRKWYGVQLAFFFWGGHVTYVLPRNSGDDLRLLHKKWPRATEVQEGLRSTTRCQQWRAHSRTSVLTPNGICGSPMFHEIFLYMSMSASICSYHIYHIWALCVFWQMATALLAWLIYSFYAVLVLDVIL